LPVHRARSGRLHEALDRRHAHEQDSGPDLRVRLPRGQLFHREHAHGRTRAGQARGDKREAMTRPKAGPIRISIWRSSFRPGSIMLNSASGRRAAVAVAIMLSVGSALFVSAQVSSKRPSGDLRLYVLDCGYVRNIDTWSAFGF